MATYPVKRAKHATLVADTEDVVTFSYSGGVVRVANRGTTTDIFFTIDGSTVTVEGDDMYVVTPGTSVTLSEVKVSAVHIISSGTPKFSVELY